MKVAFNIFLLIILFIGNIFIKEQNYYYLLIYIFIFLYHLYIYIILFNRKESQNYESIIFFVISLFLFLFSYFIIYDPNPFFCLLSFYSFHPNFIKGIFIIFIHSYTLNYYINHKKSKIILQTQEKSSFKSKLQGVLTESYFLSSFYDIMLENNFLKYFIFGLTIKFSK